MAKKTYIANVVCNGMSTMIHSEPMTNKSKAIKWAFDVCRGNHFQQRCNVSRWSVYIILSDNDPDNHDNDVEVASGAIYDNGNRIARFI